MPGKALGAVIFHPFYLQPTLADALPAGQSVKWAREWAIYHNML
jgi:hypothetical protein